MDYGYLQHGVGVGPFMTERVKIKYEAPDVWLAFYEGRWRKVHAQVNRLFIFFQGEKITIRIWGV